MIYLVTARINNCRVNEADVLNICEFIDNGIHTFPIPRSFGWRLPWRWEFLRRCGPAEVELEVRRVQGWRRLIQNRAKEKKNRGDTIRFVYGLGSNNFWRREQQWWRQGRRFLAKSCERSCICFVSICFRFKINSAVVTLPYVMCRK